VPLEGSRFSIPDRLMTCFATHDTIPDRAMLYVILRTAVVHAAHLNR
jgi:hypothetical protein